MSAFTVDFDAIASNVKANLVRLETCDRHDFQPIDGAKPTFRRARCTRCGGEAESLHVRWYKLGLEHGKKLGGAR